MAGSSSWVILLGEATWEVARLTSDGVERSVAQPCDRQHLAEIAEPVWDTLREQGYSGEPVLMALGSTWCLNATITVPSARQARQRQAMAYLLEPSLPWAAEELVADYEFSGTRAFAVAALWEPLAELIQRLEERGAPVESVAPLARLALARHLAEFPEPVERFALVWGSDETVDVWLVDRGQLQSWQWIPHTVEAVTQAVRTVALSEAGPLTLFGRNLRPEVSTALSNLPDFAWRELTFSPSESPTEAGVREAALVLNGKRQAAIELRRDALAPQNRYRALRGPIRALQLAVLLFLASVGVVLYWQGTQFDALRASEGDKQSEIFRRVFPDTPVPVGVRSRLEAEYARLRGVRGHQEDQPKQVAAVRLVERLLRSLPADLRYRVLEVRIENGRLYLLGQVREHSDADRIADGLRKAALEVEAPSTNLLAGKGVEFRIAARFPDESQDLQVARGTK